MIVSCLIKRNMGPSMVAPTIITYQEGEIRRIEV
jgi:hypothetical protein